LKLISSISLVGLFLTLGAHAQSLETALEQTIKTQFPKGSRFAIERLRAPFVGAGPYQILGTIPTPALGLVSFEGTDAEGKSVKGTAYIRVWTKVAVSRVPISHHEAFTPENTRFEERELSRLAVRGYFPDVASLTGRRAKGYIAPAQSLGSHNTEMPLELQNGSYVELQSKRNGIVVSAKVRAIDSGRKGDSVRVENPTSRKVLWAKVLDSQTVEAN